MHVVKFMQKHENSLFRSTSIKKTFLFFDFRGDHSTFCVMPYCRVWSPTQKREPGELPADSQKKNANQERENCFDAENSEVNTMKFDMHLTLDHCTSPVEFKYDSANSNAVPACRSYNIYAVGIQKFRVSVSF